MRQWYRLLTWLLATTMIATVGCGDDDDDDEDEKVDAGAPYIYLYPEQGEQVSVKLLPSPGCELKESDPEYGSGWSVWAEPSGLLDGDHEFLFYTAGVNWDFQLDQGYAVEGEGIFSWFEEALPTLGLNGKETGDFIAYWSDHLPYAPCYHIFPQDNDYVDRQIGITVTPAPDSVLRLWLVIIGKETCSLLDSPTPAAFVRKGFVVVEWGVVLKSRSFVW